MKNELRIWDPGVKKRILSKVDAWIDEYAHIWKSGVPIGTIIGARSARSVLKQAMTDNMTVTEVSEILLKMSYAKRNLAGYRAGVEKVMSLFHDAFEMEITYRCIKKDIREFWVVIDDLVESITNHITEMLERQEEEEEEDDES